MKTNYLKLILFAAAFAVAGFIGVSNAQAQTAAAQIVFPVVELGNCVSNTDCRTYCDKLEHVEACISFGRAHGLTKQDQSEVAAGLQNVKTGPGGCTDRNSCKQYCEDSAHAAECAKFAREHGLLTDDQANKFQKLKEALKDKTGPGGCHDQRTCETFCAERSHNDECLKFAQDHGLVGKDEAQQIKKFQEALTSRQTPGNCTSKEDCQAYCAIAEHRSECADFAQKIGLIKAQEAEQLKEGFVGPGGCTSKEECATFCNDSTNQQTCLDFAKQHQIIRPQQEQVIKDSSTRLDDLKNASPSIRTCVKQVLGENAETARLTPDSADAAAIRSCFEKYQSQTVNQDSQKPTQSNTQRPPPLAPALRDCILKISGRETLEKIQSGQAEIRPELKQKIADCLKPAQTENKLQTSPQTNSDLPKPPLSFPNISGTGPRTVPEPFRSDQ